MALWPTTGQLRSELTPLAHQAIRESIRAEASDSTTGRIGAFLQSQVATRSLEPGEGTARMRFCPVSKPPWAAAI